MIHFDLVFEDDLSQFDTRIIQKVINDMNFKKGDHIKQLVFKAALTPKDSYKLFCVLNVLQYFYLQ